MKWEIAEILTIVHTENNYSETNILEEFLMTRAATSSDMQNDIISGKNELLFQILTSVDRH